MDLGIIAVQNSTMRSFQLPLSSVLKLSQSSYGLKKPTSIVRYAFRHTFCRASNSGSFNDDQKNDSSSIRNNFSNRVPQEDVLQAISELSRLKGRQSKTTNVVMGGTASAFGSDWLELDQKVNSYPSLRGFTAIGTGGDDFVQSMVFAVESVMQFSIPEGTVQQKLSAKGNYISVKIGPLRVESSEQVQAVYQAMRSDSRMKYFL